MIRVLVIAIVLKTGLFAFKDAIDFENRISSRPNSLELPFVPIAHLGTSLRGGRCMDVLLGLALFFTLIHSPPLPLP